MCVCVCVCVRKIYPPILHNSMWYLQSVYAQQLTLELNISLMYAIEVLVYKTTSLGHYRYMFSAIIKQQVEMFP